MGDHDLVPPLVGNETSATEKGHGRLKDQGYYVIPVDRKTLRFGQGSFIPRQNLSATKDPAGFLPPEAFANRLIHQDDFVKHIDLDIDGSDDDPNSTSPELKKVNTESKKMVVLNPMKVVVLPTVDRTVISVPVPLVLIMNQKRLMNLLILKSL